MLRQIEKEWSGEAYVFDKFVDVDTSDFGG